MPKLNQKYQISPVKKEIVYEAQKVEVNLPIADMDNIAVMDSEDFFNQPIKAGTNKGGNQNKVYKKRKPVEQLQTMSDDIDEDEVNNTARGEKRIKFNQFVLPKGT